MRMWCMPTFFMTFSSTLNNKPSGLGADACCYRNGVCVWGNLPQISPQDFVCVLSRVHSKHVHMQQAIHAACSVHMQTTHTVGCTWCCSNIRMSQAETLCWCNWLKTAMIHARFLDIIVLYSFMLTHTFPSQLEIGPKSRQDIGIANKASILRTYFSVVVCGKSVQGGQL